MIGFVSRDCHASRHASCHVTTPARSRGCHATITPPHLNSSFGAAVCGVSGSNRIRSNGYLPQRIGFGVDR